MKDKVMAMPNRGDLLLAEKPFVYVLKSKFRTERCDYCFQRSKLLKCSGCHYVYYCNRECQKSAWIDHKTECVNLRKISPKIIPDAARLMARIIQKLKRGGDQETSYYTKTRFRKFKDLMSHYSDIKQDKIKMDHFSSLCGVLVEYLGEDNFPNTAELMGIYGRMCINSFNILDPEMCTIGTGIYLAVSILDHSCEPNAVATFEGTTINIRALEQMASLDWSKGGRFSSLPRASTQGIFAQDTFDIYINQLTVVFICYIELLNTAKARREELQATYYFLCECRACLNPLPTHVLSCTNTQCCSAIEILNNVDLMEENVRLQCSKCHEHIKSSKILEYKQVEEFTLSHLETMKSIAYLDVCKVILKKQNGLFHNLDLLAVKILDSAFDSSIEMNQWEEAIEFGTELIPGYKKYYGENHPLMALLLMKIGKIYLYLENFSKGLNNLQQAESIIRITHGIQHELYKKELIPLIQDAMQGHLSKNY